MQNKFIQQNPQNLNYKFKWNYGEEQWIQSHK